jgi:hypothetical protein
MGISRVGDNKRGSDEGDLRPSRTLPMTAWSFIYIFFTNGIPFDSPNRSEPCPLP